MQEMGGGKFSKKDKKRCPKLSDTLNYLTYTTFSPSIGKAATLQHPTPIP